MKETHASTATVLAAEQDSQPRTPPVASPAHATSHSGLLYVIAGTVLCVAGGVGVYVAYTQYLAVSAPVVLTPTATAPIFVDDREQVSGVGADLARALETAVSRPLASGAVRLLYLANTDSTGLSQATTTDSVFFALHLPAPAILLRNVNASGSMAGVVNVAGSQTLFFILSAASYSNTFSGMLSWETLMPRDIGTLLSSFVATPSVSTATTSTMTATTSTEIASTTTIVIPAETSPAPVVSTPAFRDDVVANHDVRIYRDAAGEEVLLYGYWNQTTLIIAHDSTAFAEIVQRLATSHTQ